MSPVKLAHLSAWDKKGMPNTWTVVLWLCLFTLKFIVAEDNKLMNKRYPNKPECEGGFFVCRPFLQAYRQIKIIK